MSDSISEEKTDQKAKNRGSLIEQIEQIAQYTKDAIESLLPNTMNNNNNNNIESKQNIRNDMFTIEDDGIKNKNSDIISKLWNELLGESMFKRLFNSKDWETTKTWYKLCNRLDLLYPIKHLEPIHLIGNNISLLREIKYAIRCAISSYPNVFLLALKITKDVSIATKNTPQLLKDVFNINNNDVLFNTCDVYDSMKTHEPSFFMMMDKITKSIVISISGTKSVTDILTDVDCKSKSIKIINNKNNETINGYIHEGIYIGAKYIYNIITPKLIDIYNKWGNTYKIIICGHSLGGGISNALGLLYYNHEIIHNKMNLKIYSFASPPCVSKNLMNLCNEYIYSIILSSDIVTRLSLQNVKLMNRRIEYIKQTNSDIVYESMFILNDKPLNNNNTHQDVYQFLDKLKNISLNNQDTNKQLYPCGTILWFVPEIIFKEKTIIKKRQKLMGITDQQINEYNAKQNIINSPSNDSNNIEMKNNENNDDINIKSLKDIFMEGFTNLKDNIIEWNENMKKKENEMKDKYTGKHWILCDATKSKEIFLNFAFDSNESGYAHLPQRYLWVLDARLYA